VASGQASPPANAFFIARVAGGDCAPSGVTVRAGAMLPSLAVPGAATAPVLLKQKLIRTQPEAPPKTGAPYSAVGTTEMVQTLADGNRIVHTNTSRYYRDSSGRTRTEMSLSAVGPFTLDESRAIILINDPVAKQRIVLHPDQKHAELLPFGPISVTMGPDQAIGSVGSPAPGNNAVAGSTPAPLPPPQCPPGGAAAQPTTLSLGQKSIAGLTATGTRLEYTIPAGQIGNEAPISVTSEQWVSDDLGVLLSSTEQDPLVGNTQFQLSQIQRAEPDPSLFAVPAGYAVTDVTAGKQLFIQRPDSP